MNLLRERARAWIQSALIASFPDNHAANPQALEEYGDALFLIGETHHIPDEHLFFWIHDKPRGKDWSLASWRGSCRRYADLQAQVGTEESPAPASDPSAPKEEISALCANCWANELQTMHDGRQWCAKCGEVQL